MRIVISLLLYFLCMVHSVQAQQAYAVLGDDGQTVTFYYDTQKDSRGGVPLSDWKSDDCQVKKAVFDNSFDGYLPTSISAWFRDCSQLETIIGIENLNTTNVTNMQAMFLNCSSLTTLDLSSFNTENVTNMIQVFYGCSSLTNINLSNFNTTKVTNMTGLFYKCTSLTNIDLSSFNTPNVKDISGLVQLCSSLKTLDLRNFDTSKVTTMNGMFYGCSSLTQLNLNCFDTTNVSEMSWMFSGCTSLITIDVSNFNTEKVTGMHHMFYQCSSLESLDLSSFNTVSVERIWNMFTDCSSLKTIYASEKWCTDNVTNGGGMFNKCIKLVGGMGTTYDETKTNHAYAHIDGGADNPGYFTDISAKDKNTPYIIIDDNTVAAHFLQPDEEGKVEIPATVEIDGKTYTVTEIAANAFKDNKELTEVTIPGTVTKIGDGAFAGCENLRAIYVYAPEPISLTAAKAHSMMTRAAENVPSQFEGIDFEACTLYVPIGSEQKYREADGWKLFTHIVGVEAPSGITTIRTAQNANGAIYNLSGQRLATPKKGLNIIGSKKVVVK